MEGSNFVSTRPTSEDWRVIPSCPDYMINRYWQVREIRTGKLVQREKGESWSVHIYDGNGNRVHRGVRKLYRQAFKRDS